MSRRCKADCDCDRCARGASGTAPSSRSVIAHGTMPPHGGAWMATFATGREMQQWCEEHGALILGWRLVETETQKELARWPDQ